MNEKQITKLGEGSVRETERGNLWKKRGKKVSFSPLLVWISLCLVALSVQRGWLSTDLWGGMTVKDKRVFSLRVSVQSLASFNTPCKDGKDGLWLRFPSVTQVASQLIRLWPSSQFCFFPLSVLYLYRAISCSHSNQNRYFQVILSFVKTVWASPIWK